MDVRLSGQVGNWLFHTAAAVKEFGKEALTGAVSCTNSERFERSKAMLRGEGPCWSVRKLQPACCPCRWKIVIVVT